MIHKRERHKTVPSSFTASKSVALSDTILYGCGCGSDLYRKIFVDFISYKSYNETNNKKMEKIQMISITDFSSLPDLSGNKVFVDAGKSFLENSTVCFNGTGNILFVEDGVKLSRSTVKFMGNNCLIYLKKSSRVFCVQIDVYNNSTVYIGGGNYFNGALHMSASEEKNVVIGDDGLYSFDTWIRTADPHLVYSTESHERLNPSQSVFIGDHVWIGQSAIVLKRSVIGSGSVIGAASVVAGKKVPSNVSFGGNPARLIRKGVFFLGESVHGWTEEKAKEFEICDEDRWIYEDDGKTLNLAEIDAALTHAADAQERLDIVKSTFAVQGNKNRFFVPLPKEEKEDAVPKKKGFFTKK